MFWRTYKRYISGFILVFLFGCVEPYAPEIIETDHDFLVVSGFINSSGPTTFRLTRTQNLDGTNIPPAERKAKLFVENEQGTPIALPEQTDGSYAATLTINQGQKYRLRIKTANNKEYLSEYVQSKTVPVIDNVRWEAVDNNLLIYVNAHDDQKKTQYYRWDYEETWEFHTPFESRLEYKNGKVDLRTNNIWQCWRSAKSSSINIASSTKLNQDIISNYPLIKLGSNSIKLPIKYSVLVKQYALTPEAYSYFEILKKNTESIGTLFDPLPSQLTGNIRCLSNPGEPVIGFVTATAVQEKRLFIARAQLPLTWRTDNEYNGCLLDTTFLKDVARDFTGGNLIPVSDYNPEGVLFGYFMSDIGCVDCRLRGTNVRPAFWQ